MTTTTAPDSSPAIPAGLLPAVGYLRLSDSRIEGELDLRIDKLRERAAAEGWHLTEILMERDEGRRNSGVSAFKQVTVRGADGTVTGLAVLRPMFDQLVTGLFSGRYQRVLTEDISRLMRRGRDNERLIDAVEYRGADVLSLSGTINLRGGGTDAERQQARIMASMAEQFSRDMTRRVAGGRERHAATSWGGGRRPFGYEPDEYAPKHHKTLIQVPAEAAVIRKAAADVLGGTSLKAVTRDLRERAASGEPGTATVTGTPWQTRSLRGVLTSGAVAGKAVRKGQILGDAPWEPILDEPTWTRLRTLFADETRRTNRGSGNEPKWLLSLFAECGVCHKRLTVGGAGEGRSPAYVGKECGHVRRTAKDVDNLISEAVVAWLEKYADSDRLRPAAPAADGHAKALRTELARLRKQRKALLEIFDGDADALAVIRAKEARMTAIDGQLAAAVSEPDPLAGFREGNPRAAWDAAPMPRKRALVQALIESVVIERAGRTGRVFHPETVAVTWRPQAGAPRS
jgi:site-specific DNA recombinase